MDRKTRLVWLGTGVAVAVVWAVGLTLGKRESPRPVAATAPTAVPPEPDADDLAATAGAADQAQATPESEPQPGPEPLAQVQAPAAAPAHPKSPGQVLPGVFLTETPDPYWATDAEAKVRAAFADAHVPEGSLLGVECRRRICKADLWFDSRDHVSFGKAYATLREHFGIDFGFVRVSGGIRGEPEHIAGYFPRKGYTLQDLESPAQ